VEVQPASPAASFVSEIGSVASNVMEKVRGCSIVTRSHATLNRTSDRATSSGGREPEISLTPYAPHKEQKMDNDVNDSVVAWYK